MGWAFKRWGQEYIPAKDGQAGFDHRAFQRVDQSVHFKPWCRVHACHWKRKGRETFVTRSFRSEHLNFAVWINSFVIGQVAFKQWEDLLPGCQVPLRELVSWHGGWLRSWRRCCSTRVCQSQWEWLRCRLQPFHVCWRFCPQWLGWTQDGENEIQDCLSNWQSLRAMAINCVVADPRVYDELGIQKHHNYNHCHT